MELSWPELFRRKVAANARFWLGQVSAPLATPQSLATERGNVVKALIHALQLEAAWEPAVELLLAFHPYMARQGAATPGVYQMAKSSRDEIQQRGAISILPR